MLLAQRERRGRLAQSELQELVVQPQHLEQQELAVLPEHLGQVALWRREESERLARTELRVWKGRPAGQEVREPKIVVARCLPRVGFHREDCQS